MRLSLPAWQGNHYVSLTELLMLLGEIFPSCQWFAHIHEVSSEPGSELLASCDPFHPLTINDLIKFATPDIQVIDGEFIAINADGQECLLLRAVDSTSWDIETEHPTALAVVKDKFPAAVPAPDQDF